MTIKNLEIPGSEEQGTLDWKKARLGKFTASSISNLMSRGRGKDAEWGDKAITEMAEKAGERKIAPDVRNNEEELKLFFDLQCRENMAMRHGHEWEDSARTMYEVETGTSVDTCGLLLHSSVPYLAYSPDGCVCDTRGTIRGLIEIKCPSTIKTYQRYKWFINDAESLKKEKPEYYWQVQTGMAVTGAKWCDFIVFNPWMEYGLKVVRIQRNQEDVEALEERVIKANLYIGKMEGQKQEETLFDHKETPKVDDAEVPFPDNLESHG